jgi:methyltransferase family protein
MSGKPPQVASIGCASYLANLADANTTSVLLQQSTAAHRRFFRQVKGILLRPEFLYRLSLKLQYGAGRMAVAPGPRIMNRTLQSRVEWQAAYEHAKGMKLPLHRGPEKNWDHLAAVTTILSHTKLDACVLDAGAEMYSNVLPALFLYGYRNLHGINLSFTAPTRRGPIRYIPGDLTRTPYYDAFFDAITSMSVIEHGVPLEAYFREMFRLLKPGGLLITSTDYFPEPIDTRGQSVHGAPIKIFSRREIEAALQLAESIGFEQTGELNLDCNEKPIRWDQFGLDYTFVLFTLRKPE